MTAVGTVFTQIGTWVGDLVTVISTQPSVDSCRYLLFWCCYWSF